MIVDVTYLQCNPALHEGEIETSSSTVKGHTNTDFYNFTRGTLLTHPVRKANVKFLVGISEVISKAITAYELIHI